jgi:tetratricopeptide (TPR) repeat protein
VASDARVVLLDFGLTTGFDPRESDTTFGGKLVGTAGYISPEQCAGKQPTTQSDWYSVGVVLYQALVGYLPFHGPAAKVLTDKRRMDPPAPCEVNAATPKDLNDLCMALLNRHPERRPSGQDILRLLGKVGSLAAASSHPYGPRLDPGSLLGRNTHLSTLSKTFDAVCAGQAVTVYLRGSSGMGKTALMHYFLDGLVENRGALVLRGRAHERESVPYKAFDAVIDALSRQLLRMPAQDAAAVVPEDGWALARVFPVLARVPAVREVPEPAEVGTPGQLRRRAFLALRAMLDAIARRRRLVLLLDDLQWGDVDSANLLLEVMRPPQPPPLLLIGCYRSEDVDSSVMLRALSSHRRARGAEVVELAVGPLRYADANELALVLLESEDQEAREQASSIAFEAKGSPFLITELARWAKRLRATGGAKQSQDGLISLHTVLQERLSTLAEGGWTLLELAAVSGRPVDLGVLVEAAGLGERQRDAIAALRAQKFVRTSHRAGREVAEPYDDRIREVVLSRMNPVTVRGAHHRLAQVHASLAPHDAEALAEHCLAAGDPARGSHYAELAADRASAALAFEHAARLYQIALAHRRAPLAQMRQLHVHLGDALVHADKGVEAARSYRRAASCTQDEREAADLNRRAAEQLLRNGLVDEGLSVLEDVLEANGMRLPVSSKAALRPLKLNRLRVRLRGLRFRERQQAELPDQQIDMIDVTWAAATGLSMVDTVSAAEFQTRNLLLALRAGEPLRVARALCGEAVQSAAHGPKGGARAIKVLDMAREIAQRIDSLDAMGVAAAATGIASYLQGQWKSAREWCDRAEPILSELCTGAGWELAVTQLFGLNATFYLGDLHSIAVRLPAVLADADAREDVFAATSFRVGYANLTWLVRGDQDSAARNIREAAARWTRSRFGLVGFAIVLAEANLLLYSGQGERAWQIVKKHRGPLADSQMMRVHYVRVESLYLRARAALAAVAEREATQSVINSAHRDTEALSADGAPWAAALACLIRACAAQITGDTSKAIGLFSQAEDRLMQCGMTLHAAVARRRLGRLVGGMAGSRLIGESDAWMLANGVCQPDRLAEIFAPGGAGFRDA